MMIVQMPSGSWGIGPSLLYLFGLLAGLAWVDWKFRDKRQKTKEEMAEERKKEVFTRLLIEAAEERKK